MKNENKTNKDQINKNWYHIGLFLGGIISTPKVFAEGIQDIREERKERKERKKVYKGLLEWKKLMEEMDASGVYSEEVMDKIHRNWAAACVEYGKMF